MIFIDKHPELVLVRRLEAQRATGDALRCIQCELHKLPAEDRMSVDAWMALLPTVLDEHAADAQLFQLRNGDMVVARSQLHAWEVRALECALPENHRALLKIHELDGQLANLLVSVETQMASYAAQEREQRQQEEARQAARRREAILSFSPDPVLQQHMRRARMGRSNDEVLIIEDDAFSRRLLENVLPKTVTVTGVESPDRALGKYAILMPDVLFLDINLPDVSGHELLERILAMDPQAYVIMISGDADRDNVVKAMSKGASGFIAKPFNRERVYEYLQRCPTLHRKVPHAYS